MVERGGGDDPPPFSFELQTLEKTDCQEIYGGGIRPLGRGNGEAFKSTIGQGRGKRVSWRYTA